VASCGKPVLNGSVEGAYGKKGKKASMFRIKLTGGKRRKKGVVEGNKH